MKKENNIKYLIVIYLMIPRQFKILFLLIIYISFINLFVKKLLWYIYIDLYLYIYNINESTPIMFIIDIAYVKLFSPPRLPYSIAQLCL